MISPRWLQQRGPRFLDSGAIRWSDRRKALKPSPPCRAYFRESPARIFGGAVLGFTGQEEQTRPLPPQRYRAREGGRARYNLLIGLIFWHSQPLVNLYFRFPQPH